MKDPTIKAEWIAKWKQYAKDHYTDGGWDVVVECWDDAEWDDLVESSEDYEAAEDTLKGTVDVWADRQADAKFYQDNA